MLADHEIIRQHIETGRADEAIRLADSMLSRCADDSLLHYLKGQAYMKKGDWQHAINCFLRSEENDPQGPAAQAREMLSDIMDFYNKDMYNQ